jgi:glyoxylate/hydroxypyruvate reductase A
MQRRRAWEPLEVRTLAGLTIGVAGLGSIGREMVRKARAFDMRVLGLSRTGDAPAGMDRLFRPDEWLGFVQDLDVLVLTLPLTAETEGVVNRDVLAAMPDRALLVNVGRGGLIVEEDLVAALRSGKIAGAVLDVFAQEPLPADSPLWTMPGVTVTPHISGPSTIDGVAGYFLANLYRYMRGDPLVGMVDRARGY